MALKPFLRFQDSRPGLFYDLSTGEFCPLRIPLAPSIGSGLGAAVSPADKSGKNSGLKTMLPSYETFYLSNRGEVWESSKGRIFRIKSPLLCDAARAAVCTATAHWYPLTSIPADRREGRLWRRSRCGLEKSAMPSRLNFILIYGGRASQISFQIAHPNFCRTCPPLAG
jgi:hypothetical protein